ncbi:hypothetical protein [uncultured Gimesia sp.]|uniref:hypothetical protein n=1 Tax=uncultured Gimesia sp. TaxID=1678688 RepID=UPI00262F6CE2|nr:hypothetical protein [uncultured Gimesia sp.]
MSVKHEKNNQSSAHSSAGCEENQVSSLPPAPLNRTEKSLPEDVLMASQQQLIPPRLKVLFVSDKRPVWVGLALRLDSIGCVEPRFGWVSTSEEALTLLRDDSYDCLLIGIDFESKSKQLSLLNAIRGSGCHDPIVLMLAMPDDEVVLAGCEYQAQILVSAAMWESPALLGTMKRAMMVYQLGEDNHRLLVENHRRLVRERDESERLLKQQRSMVEELQTLTYPIEPEKSEQDQFLSQSQIQKKSRQTSNEFHIPLEVQDYYHELLRTYVIMGSGSLKDEILQIAELLAAANLTPGQVLEFHLKCVEVIVKGLGNRSSRHVMSRADLLALEIMVHLGECYQKRSTP